MLVHLDRFYFSVFILYHCYQLLHNISCNVQGLHLYMRSKISYTKVCTPVQGIIYSVKLVDYLHAKFMYSKT